ncbi:HD-GYP domain-containing protein [Clostridium thermarum]|uniref:HD-GYP domain-containing protein n=1 Tax=Clostridium thermarum TaxID=1716543 RepID=UPI0013D3E8F1|nr:HD-GYP domain-containing protein [Clostridium thermarum]
MRLEFINRVCDGEVLGKSILSSDGKILLRAGVKLTSQYINKLRELGVFYVYIEDHRLEDICVEDERLLELKKDTIKNMSVIMKGINNCSRANFNKSLRKVEELIDYIIDDGVVSGSLCDIKTYDNYTYLHSIDTGIMAAYMGLAFNFKERELKDLGIGAVLHDIGKTKINCNIINKTGALNEEELMEIRKHPSYGAEILRKNYSISKSIIDIVEQHHERMDGRGYPYGLKGWEISKYAKLVSVCDVYDAVSSDRSYRKKLKPNESYELILAGSGTAFEDEVVKKFKETFSVYPLGCCIRLSNGVEGYVIKQNNNFPDRPIIRVLYDTETKSPIPFYEIDLLKENSLTVEAMV